MRRGGIGGSSGRTWRRVLRAEVRRGRAGGEDMVGVERTWVEEDIEHCKAWAWLYRKKVAEEVWCWEGGYAIECVVVERGGLGGLYNKGG